MKILDWVKNITNTNNKQDNYHSSNDLFSSDFSFTNNLVDLWTIKTSKKDSFFIMKKNVIVSAAWKLLSNRVGANWIQLKDSDGNIVDVEKDAIGREVLERANYFFSTPSLYNYIYRSFGMMLWAGQKFSTVDVMNGTGKAIKESKIKILDSRYINIEPDSYWKPMKYTFRWIETFAPSTVVDYIIFEDLDNPIYGQSQIESIIIDALSDQAIGNRQLVFFRNNAMPNIVYMLDKSKIKSQDQVKEFKKIIQENHWGNKQSSKPLASTFIDDIKILEMSHKDLDLINQRLFAHKEAGIILWFDLRLLSYMKDTGWSFSEMDSLTLKNANSQIEVYSKRIEDGMLMEYERFIWEIPYTFKLSNELYKDIKSETEIIKEWISAGLITPNEWKELLDMQPSKDKRLDEYYQATSLSIMWSNEKPKTAQEPTGAQSIDEEWEEGVY